MTPRKWYVIATMMMLTLAPALVSAATNRVLNPDFETAGDDSCDIPDWQDYHADEGRLCKTHRVNTTGTAGGAALLIVGPEVRQTQETFAVNVDPLLAPETLEFSLDHQVLLGAFRAVVQLRDADGRMLCGGAIGGGSIDNFIPEVAFTHDTTSVVACTGTVAGEVLIGGSYWIDPLTIVSAPVGMTIVDNIFVGN